MLKMKVAKLSVVGAMALGGIGTVVLGAGSASAATAASTLGCASGFVCIYNTYDDVVNGNVQARFEAYGANNLTNEFGDKWIFNNQYGGDNATAVLCYGYNGVNCDGNYTIYNEGLAEFNLTPFNSIWLNRP